MMRINNNGFSPVAILLIVGVIFVSVSILLIRNISIKNISSKKPNDQLVTTTPTISPEGTQGIGDKVSIDTKEYISSALEISFSYPSTYGKPEERENYLSLISPHILNKGFQLNPDELKIEIYREKSIENDSSEQCFKDHSSSSNIISQEAVKVGGIEAVNFHWEGYGSGESICVIRGEWRYSINKYLETTTRDNEFSIFLDSFKFLD